MLYDVAEALMDLNSTQQQLNNQQHGAQEGESGEPAGWWRQQQAQLVRALSSDLTAGVGLEGQGRVGQQAGQPLQQQQSEAERDVKQDDGGRTAKQARVEPVIAAMAQQGQQQQAQGQQQQQVEDDDLTELVDGADSTSSDDDADSGSSGVHHRWQRHHLQRQHRQQQQQGQQGALRPAG